MRNLIWVVMVILGWNQFQISIEATDDLNVVITDEQPDTEALVETNYEPNLSVEDIISRLQNDEASGKTTYETVIDQLFNIDSVLDLFNPYYYYSINTETRGDRESSRQKIVSAYCDPYFYEVAMTNSDGTFEHVGCLETFEEAQSLKDRVTQLQLSFEQRTPVVLHDGMIVMSIGPAIVQFKTTGCGANHNLYASGESKSNHDTYVNACYIDEAFLVDESAEYLQIFMSGYDGWISRHALYDEASSNETWISIIPEVQVQNTSHYKVENGDLVHYISKDIRDELAYSTLIIGVAPDYLEEGQTYYSYDGNYFYEAWNKIAVNGVGAINEATPFYNYFQYLPYRSKTNYRLGELDAYIAMQGYTEKILGVSPLESQSQLVGEGESFIMAQEQFGINGALEMAMAIHESAFGRSKIAIEKNNMFGMNATDNNPYGNATVFSSIRNGIFYHAERYMSWGYTDALTDFRYFGSHVGNKESGMNVKYASDPYWGEKIASHYYRLDKALGLKDLNYYQLAIKQDERQIPVQANVDEVSDTLYETLNEKSNILINNYPFLVVGVVGDYLQIQSDMPVSLDLNEVVMDAPYVFGTSYGYVPLQDLYRVNDQSYQIPDAIKQYVQLNRGDLLDLSTHLESFENVRVEIENLEVLSLNEASVLVASGAGVSAVSMYANDELVKAFDVRVVIPVEKVSIDQVETTLEVGQTLRLSYDLLPLEASNQQVMWISSDPLVATVNELGEVVANSVGEVVIELLSDEAGFRDEIKIKVN